MNQENIVPKHTDVVRPKRLPRYTSYPTALEFDALDAKTHDAWLRSLPMCEPISLYFHIPYCEKLCWFCGCFTTISNKYGPVETFLDVLKQEIRQTAKKTGRLKVSHIHFGGGSPSILEADDFASLIEVVKECYNIDENDEFAVEIDPRTVDRDKIFSYAKAGVNRVSLGIQDFNEKTQVAINRVQPVELITENMQSFKDAGIDHINFDVPHMKKHQKMIEDHAIPDQKERQAQFELASRMLTENGYRSIGLDHFALPDDHLFVSFDQGKLKRNFQGYTEDKADTLIGFGPSAISSMPDGYAQNIPMIRPYLDKVSAGQSPVVRGLSVTAEDKMFRDVISTLMCYFAVEPLKIASAHGIDYDFEREFSNLNKLVSAGYMEKTGLRYSITEAGELYLRAIATVFDQYFDQTSDIIDRCIHESEG